MTDHSTLDKLAAQTGCRHCAAYFLEKEQESRLTEIERKRMEEVLERLIEQ